MKDCAESGTGGKSTTGALATDCNTYGIDSQLVGVHMDWQGHRGHGELIVVVGAGGVGLNAVSGGGIAGAVRIIAVDVDDAKLDKARRFGESHTVNSRTVDPVAAVRALTGGESNHAFDFVGMSAVLQQNLNMLGVSDRLYPVGPPIPRRL